MEQAYNETVLIVDDTKFMRFMLREIFEKNGFNVVGEGCDGEEGINMYEELLPDLTTLDINMPKKDGIETLKAIRKIDPAAQVIMVSAMGTRNRIMEAVKCGAKNFIVKPFDEKKVIEVVNSVLKIP